MLGDNVVMKRLTEHVDYLSSAVIDRPESLIIQSAHCRSSDVAAPGPPDDHDHVGVEEYQQTHGDQKEEAKGELMNRVGLKDIDKKFDFQTRRKIF